MNFDALKTSILNYIQYFTMYDYIAYAWLILTFFITILLAIVLAKRSVILSLLTLIFALILLISGPFILKTLLDSYLRPSNANITLSKKLLYSDILLVNGSIQNNSQKNFSICTVSANIFKYAKSGLNKYIYKLKPFRKKTISVKKELKVNETEEFKIIFYNFTYPNDINITVSSECY